MSSTIAGTEDFSNGDYQLPDPGEDGLAWALAIEDFMRRIAAHSHTGADSADIVININKIDQPQVGLAFLETAPNTGVFESADILIPAGATIDSLRRFYSKNGLSYEEFYPSIVYISASIYRIHTNVSIPDFKVLYY